MSWWKAYPWRMVQTNLREIDMADMDAERFAQDLYDFGATAVTLNAGGILASYESKLPYQTVSRFLTGSSLKEILAACHAKGIKVIARMDFSKIPYRLYEQHPDWAFYTFGGDIIEQNGFVQTCQNSEYQQEKAMEILKELLTEHPFDGVFCNMSDFAATDYRGNVYGFCACERCRRGFREAFHLDAPVKMDRDDPVMAQYMRFQADAGKRIRKKMNAVIKGIRPEAAVDKVDYLRTESHTEIGEPVWVYSASSNSRRTAGANRLMVSDNASVDFMGFRYRESGVSPGVMELRQWQNLANAGAVSVYIMGRLDNHRDRAFYEGTRTVFQFHKKQERILFGLVSAAEVLLAAKSRPGRADLESRGWIRALTESHIPFDEIKTADITAEALCGKRAVILADASDLTAETAAALDAFAENGGTVIASGDSGVHGSAASLKCLGIERILEKKRGLMSTVFTVTPEDEKTFCRCALSPVIAPGPEVTCAVWAEDVRQYLHTRPEPLFGPPEVCYAKEETAKPGLTVRLWGKGKGIFIPWFCGSFYQQEGYTNTLNFMQDVLFGICGLPELAPNLHPSVELVLSKKKGMTVLSLINGSGYFGNSFFSPVPMRDITVTLPGTFCGARALNGGNAEAVARENRTEVRLDSLEHFEMIVLEEKE